MTTKKKKRNNTHRLQKHAAVLKWLSQAKPKAAKTMIKVADNDLVDALGECSLNILAGNVPLTTTEKKKLSRYKTPLRTVAKKTVARKKKKALLQKGGFLGAILGPILGVLGHILFK